MVSSLLPPPTDSQAHCQVSVLEGGQLQLPLNYVLDTASETDVVTVPALTFLLRHSHIQGKHLLFDLGIRKDFESYPPAIQRLLSVFGASVSQDVVESLAKGRLPAGEIQHIAISHVHWDHTGNPSLFPNAHFYLGAGGRENYRGGYPENPDSAYPTDYFPWDTRVTLLSPDQNWKPLGPFPHALDFWGDGSLYLVDAPGHMPGHINILARTSADGGWVYLAGDSAHDWCLLHGTAGMRVEKDENGKVTRCMHMDVQAARETIRRIGEVSKIDRVRVILAHDKEWYTANSGGSAFWPGKLESF